MKIIWHLFINSIQMSISLTLFLSVIILFSPVFTGIQIEYKPLFVSTSFPLRVIAEFSGLFYKAISISFTKGFLMIFIACLVHSLMLECFNFLNKKRKLKSSHNDYSKENVQ
ncbi:hypothetical protein KQ41_06215 [Lysinibacillus fusiformis]|nr:hypothetical protein KQ41_06215 [Lysinibacillus fusiformis]